MTDKKPAPEVLVAILAKAKEKLAVARSDLENRFFDDAASRSYYAAFHAITAVLASKGLSFSSHGQTLGAFNKQFVQTGIFLPEAFRKAQKLFKDRQIGDYDFSQSVGEQAAVEDVDNAAWLVAVCEEYVNSNLD
jgi:uncharacterized protein (UPF0332 family)